MLARTRESQFITKVFPAELREISGRRGTLGITRVVQYKMSLNGGSVSNTR